MSEPFPPEPTSTPPLEPDVVPPRASGLRAAIAAPRPYQARSGVSKLSYLAFIGLFLAIIGIFWHLVEEDTGWVTKAWIFLSIVAVFVPIAWHIPDILRSIASRRGGAFLFVLTTVTLGVFVAAFAGWASVKFKARLPSIDLTSASEYTLKEESVKLLEKVEGTVYATYLMRGDTDEGLRQKSMEQLRTYESASPRVKFAEVDEIRKPELARSLMAKHGITRTSSGEDTDVIVLTYAEPGKEVAPGKQKEIKVEPWAFRKTSSTGAEKWLGESVISSGIYELVFQRYRAYATGGHGEGALGEQFRELRECLEGQNIEVASEPLNLAMTPEVPKDCEMLLILGPTKPFTPDEADAVTRWLEKGHTLFFTVDLQEERTLTGLDALLGDRFGLWTRSNYEVIAPQIGRINVNGQDMQMVAGMGSQFPVSGESFSPDHPAARALRARAGLSTYFRRSTYVEVQEEKPPAGAEPKVVAYAPERRGTMPVALKHDKSRTDYSAFKKDVDKENTKLPLLATSTLKVPGSERDARVILSGDTDVFTDDVINNYPANLDLARGLIQWGLRREGLVAVSDRSLENPYVTPDERQKRFALYWPMAVIFLPLILGCMVWWSRRR